NGRPLGKERETEELCARFQACYDDAASHRYTQRNVLYLIWKDPWMTVSRDTYISRTLALFGLNTLPAESADRYPRLTREEPWRSGVGEVLLSSEPYSFREEHLHEVSERLER